MGRLQKSINGDAPMRVLLLGGTGFIGNSLRRQRPSWIWTSVGREQCDLTDTHTILDVDDHFDVVINAAGFYGGLVFNQHYQHEILYTNAIISMNVCRLVQSLKPQKFINIGSACIYPKTASGQMKENLIGTGPYHPSVQYSAMSKAWMLETMSTLDIPWEYLILSNVYGPGEHIDFERSHFVGSMLNKINEATNTLQMFGTGVGIRDFIYLTDAAESICRYAELNTASNQPTNISTGKGTSIVDMTEMLVKISQKDIKVSWGDPGDNGVLHKVLDNSKMIADIGLTLNTSIKDGLTETWKWFNNGK
jgi:nucleoside-diphosphate-sugar epimerase